MRDDMVMRSVYLRPDEDSSLRNLAFHMKVTKSDLIRSAISAKLVEWLKSNDKEVILKDLELGRRLSPAERAERARLAAEEEAKAVAKKEADAKRAAKAAAAAAAAEKKIAHKPESLGLKKQPKKPPVPSRRRSATASEPMMAGAGM